MNISRLIEALEKLKAEHGDFRVIISGEFYSNCSDPEIEIGQIEILDDLTGEFQFTNPGEKVVIL